MRGTQWYGTGMARLWFRQVLRAEQDTIPLTRSLPLCLPRGTSGSGMTLFLMLLSPSSRLSGAQTPSAGARGIALEDALLVKPGPSDTKVVVRQCQPLCELC